MKKIKLLFIVMCMFLLCSCGEKTYNGTLRSKESAKDLDLDIEVDAPILVRVVEMVQYHKDDNGNPELVLANYHLESFDGYENPHFPTEIRSEVIHDDIYMGDIKLSNELVEAIAYSDEVNKTYLTDLPSENGNKFNLVCTGDSYVTASNEWKLGEIRVSYYYIDDKTLYKVVAYESNDLLQYCDKFAISK